MTQTAEKYRLNPRQEAAALSLAKGSSRELAAADSGAAVRTVRSWFLLPEFTKRITQLRAEMTSQALGKLTDNMLSAVDSLGYLSRNAKSEMVRVIAASKIIEMVIKVRDATELEERIAALEERQQQSQPRRRSV
jgi:hypothetical protein